MGKYDNVTARELHEKKMEMFNDLGSKDGSCDDLDCPDCPLKTKIGDKWFDCDELELKHFDEYVKIIMEYEPKVDWENVEVDTKVMGRDNNDGKWVKGHFAKYENGMMYTWQSGRTSFTSEKDDMTPWKYARLYKGDL